MNFQHSARILKIVKKEGDLREFEHCKLKCVVMRPMFDSKVPHASVHLCGYVGVPENHPLYGKDYEDHHFDIHGGLTFSADRRPVKHGDPEPPNDGLWWFGFDCNHSNDYGFPLAMGGTYRTMNYVARETRKLARQLSIIRKEK